jgi:hypothetical protein
MEPVVKCIPQEQEQSVKLKPSKPARQEPKRSNLDEVIAITLEEVRAIKSKQQLQQLNRLIEIQNILSGNLKDVTN